MITEYNCEHCNCITSSQTGSKIFVEIDEERIEQNKEDKANYLNAIDDFNKNVRNTKQEFELLVRNHNELVHWYNFMDKWYFDLHVYDSVAILRIDLKSGFSWEYIEKAEYYKPYFTPKLYKFIECHICGRRKYIE